MPAVDLVVEHELKPTARVRQLGALFDCPVEAKQRIHYQIDVPIEDQPWSVGLIVGPSGSGKSTLLRSLFGAGREPKWGKRAVIDDFSGNLEEIMNACQSVGFGTIPAWMRPYSLLSNGEQFRVTLARRLLEDTGVIAVDEFSSVVDRQVAKVASHAVQKYVRRKEKQIVAASCHYDIVNWLQPDWILDMATRQFTRRSLQRRPAIDVTIARISRAAWPVFAPFHYMSRDLSHAAKCFGLWANGVLAGFCAILHRPHQKARDIKGVSRVVILPDWQGLGLAHVLCDTLAGTYAGVGYRLRNYPAHPAFVRTYQRHKLWRQCKAAGTYSTRARIGSFGGRPCAVFEYAGPATDATQARRLLGIE